MYELNNKISFQGYKNLDKNALNFTLLNLLSVLNRTSKCSIVDP